MMAKTEQFIQRIRWKAFFFLNPDVKKSNIKTYGFKTAKTAPHVMEIKKFEHDLYEIVTNIKFTDFRSTFQRNIAQDVRNINKDEELYLIADKTTNIYKVSEDKYRQLLLNNVTSVYQQTTQTAIHDINREASAIAHKLEIADRIETLAENKAFITIKDHKDNFENNPKCRLINPAKSQIGKISKQIIDSINAEIRESLELRQWQSTQQVLQWFSDVENKDRKRFLQLDICEFYPSITEDLLNKALEFASTIDSAMPFLTHDNIAIIHHSRKSFLFTHDKNSTEGAAIPWAKKTGLFDVTMGASDGAEVCELIGLFLLPFTS